MTVFTPANVKRWTDVVPFRKRDGRVTLVVGLTSGRVLRLPRRNYVDAVDTIDRRYRKAAWVTIESFPDGWVLGLDGATPLQ